MSPNIVPSLTLKSLFRANLPRLIVSSFFVLAFGRVALFTLISVLGHTLNTADFGGFNFLLSAASWIGVIISLPHSNILFMAKYASSKNTAMSFGYVAFSLTFVILLCLMASGAALILSSHLPRHVTEQGSIWLPILIFLLGIMYWQRTVMRGEGYLFLALAPQEICLPLLAVVVCLILPATLKGALVAYVASMVITIAASGALAFLYFRTKFTGLKPMFDWGQWRLRIPHLTAGGLAEVSLGQWDIVLVGVLLNMEQTAYYAAASRVSLFTAIGLRVVETATAPLMTQILHGADRNRIGRLLAHVTLISTCVGLIVALPMLIFPFFFLHLIGNYLEQGSLALQILTVGQIINVITGPVSQALYLGGHERAYANGLWMSNIAAATAFLLLVPSFGIVAGAAVKASSVVVLNLGFAVFAYYSFRRLQPGRA